MAIKKVQGISHEEFAGAQPPWQKIHRDFKALMEEEDGILLQHRVPREGCYAYVICPMSGEFQGWFENTATESLHARFLLAATEAGIALGSPSGTSPPMYWLHRLCLDLQANNSGYAQVYSGAGGFVERLYEASTIFCTRLEVATLCSGGSVPGTYGCAVNIGCCAAIRRMAQRSRDSWQVKSHC